MRSRFWLAFAFLVILALGFFIFRRETTPRQEIYYRRGLDFARMGRYSNALQELEKVFLYDPHYAPAHNNMGVIYWKMGRKKDAITALEQAVALDPAFPEAHYNLGKLYTDLSMDEQALVHLKEAWRLAPDHERARRAIADIYYGEALEKYGDEKYNQAESSITKAYDHDPDRADILRLWGRTGIKLGQYDGAIELLEKAVEKDDRLMIDRDVSDALGRKGELLYKKGEMNEAMRYLAKALEGDPENGRANYYLGLCYSKEGNVEEAIGHLRKGLELDGQLVPSTDQAEYHASIATGMKRARSYGKAAQEYRLALAIDPGVTVGTQLGECYFWMGKDVLSRGRAEEASSYFERSVELDPDNIDYKVARARALDASDKPEKAISEYRSLLEIIPDSAEIKVDLARALMKAGLYGEAASELESVARVDPAPRLNKELAQAYYGRGLAAAQSGDYQAALSDYTRVVKVAPGRSDAWLQIGICNEEMGDLQTAVKIYKKYMDDPEIGWECHYHLGLCLGNLGDRENALAYAAEHVEKGNLFMDTGKFDEAMEEYSKSSRILPDWDTPYREKAWAHFSRQEYSKCIPYLEKSLDLAPDSQAIPNDLAVVYAKLGRFSEAEAMFHQAIKIDPHYYKACVNLSFLYNSMNKDKEANWWSKQSLLINKSFPQEGKGGVWFASSRMNQEKREMDIARAQRHLDKGDKLRDAEKLDQAMEEYRIASEIVPNWYAPHWIRAQTYYFRKEYEKCVPFLETSVKLAGPFAKPMCLNDLGVVYARLGRYEEAEKMFYKSLALKSSYRACVNMSYLYSLLNRDTEAKAFMRKAKTISRGYEYGFLLAQP